MVLLLTNLMIRQLFSENFQLFPNNKIASNMKDDEKTKEQHVGAPVTENLCRCYGAA